jgi:extradiol dioxygenase
LNISALAYVETESATPEAWRPFATEVLGASLADDSNEEQVFLRFDERHHRIAVRKGASNSLVALGWELTSRRDLDLAAQRLGRLGLDVSDVERPGWSSGKGDVVAFRDPIGYRHELLFPGNAPHAPFWPTRGISGFVAVGHTVLGVPDLDAAIRFYTEAMGFRLSDTIDASDRDLQLAFLRCNSRHHSLALYRNSTTNLHHLMVEVRALADVGTTFDICRERGIATSEIGEHSNDRTISFYLRTPSGFEIEYGFGSIVVDEKTWEVGHLDATSTWGHGKIGTP